MAHPALELLFGPSVGGGDERSHRSSGRRRASVGAPSDTGNCTDESRLERIRAGDKEVFAELYDAYFEDLSAFAFRYVRDPAAAEDVVHDVFLKIWSLHAALEVRTTLRAYLFSIVANRARDVAAQTRRDDTILSPLSNDDASAARESPHDSLESANVRDIVMAAVAALPERQRLALTLRLANDMTYDEIATVLGITKSSVAELLSKAQARLKLTLVALLP